MKRALFLLLFITLFLGRQAQAEDVLTIEITKGVQGAIPIAVVPFGANSAAPSQDVAQVVRDDLKRSGQFNTIAPAAMPARPQSSAEVNFDMWKFANQHYLVVGQVQPNGAGGYVVSFQLLDVYTGQQLLGYNVPTSEQELRRTAHHIADTIYEKLTGQPGAFATQIAFITTIREQGVKKVALMIADADGYGSQTIVTSTEPLMSPAWSPDGQRLAYVSFEDGPPGIYVQEVYTGRRQRVTSYPGINGAPAWSPDGTRLAVTLSKDGNPEIYVLSLNDRTLQRLTNQSAIDTEPSWSPDGSHIVFTSDRGGGPQIYRVSSHGGSPERLSFEGNYNARASYSPDGRSVVMVTRQGGDFSIGLMDVATKRMQLLTGGVLDESPSFTANGAMVIYGTKVNGRGELAAVSVDGRVRQRLAVRAGDVREPACSPSSRSNMR